MNLNWKPKTVSEHVLYYFLCMLLVSPVWMHAGVLADVLYAMDAMIVLGVVGLLLTRRASCCG